MTEENEEAMEEGRINLYTSEDAKRDMSPHWYYGKPIDRISGLDASIKKWDSLVRALDQVQKVAETSCGLCKEHEHRCRSDCPISDFGLEDNRTCCKEFELATKSLDKSIQYARDMLRRLRRVKEEVQP